MSAYSGTPMVGICVIAGSAMPPPLPSPLDTVKVTWQNKPMPTTQADYASRLQQTVSDAADALRETPRKAKYVKGTRKARYPFDRAAHIRALADLITEAQHQLREEIMLARDPVATAPVLSYSAIGLAADITRQAAYEQVSVGRKTRPTPRGLLPVASLLIADEDES